MKRHPVKSSNIAEAGYDPCTKTLEIEFHNGRIYRYSPITQEGWESFYQSESKGKFFAQNIRNNPQINTEEI